MFCSKYEQNSFELHIFKNKFGKIVHRKPQTLACKVAFCREIIIVQPCKTTLHILYGKLPIHNSNNALDLLYDISGPAYFNSLSATTAKKRSAVLLCRQ